MSVDWGSALADVWIGLFAVAVIAILFPVKGTARRVAAAAGRIRARLRG